MAEGLAASEARARPRPHGPEQEAAAGFPPPFPPSGPRGGGDRAGGDPRELAAGGPLQALAQLVQVRPDHGPQRDQDVAHDPGGAEHGDDDGPHPEGPLRVAAHGSRSSSVVNGTCASRPVGSSGLLRGGDAAC